MDRPEFPSDLSREQFEQVRGTLEAARRKTRPRKHDLFDVYCAVLYLLETQGAWRSMPPSFPPWRTVHEYFTQWTMLREGNLTLLERTLTTIGRDRAVAHLRKLMAPK